MNKKYELVTYNKETGLWRIRALRDFGNVKAGDFGGWVSGEHNLSQYETCWVYGNAIVSGEARIFNNARISGDARISVDARISGEAQVFGKAKIFDNARVYGDACVFGDAWIYGNAQVFDDARVFDNAQVSGYAWVHGDAAVRFDMRICHAHHDKFIRFYDLGVHSITVDGEHLNIGCESRTIKEWLEIASIVGKKEGYTEEEIRRYVKQIQLIHDEVYN
jgi:UDP-3-O-[3-hydroxymyristoyl] glucosamine N-acyltransferase